MRVLEGYKPEKVFYFFEELSKIPRGSGNEKEASDYIVNFAKERNLEYYQDELLNVIIKKPGTKGYENSPAVILQGHIDMVNEKNQDVEHDFLKDPIKIIVEDDIIRADGTTLGADNGTGVAYCLAVLDDTTLEHPPIEVLLTADEEVGMTGAKGVDGSKFDAKYMINLDCGGEGVFTAGCAGGLSQVFVFDIKEEALEDGFESLSIKVRGLLGGHSGMEIDKEKGNSNKIIGRVLKEIDKKYDMKLSHVSGGLKGNAIPREADAIISVKTEEVDNIVEFVNDYNKKLQSEYKNSDPKLNIIIEKTKKADKAFTEECKDKIIDGLIIIPSGLINKSTDIKDLTETSTNLGVVSREDNKIKMTSTTRSSVRTRLEYVKDQFDIIGDLLDVEIIREGAYPPWEFAKESKLRDLAVDSYKEITGKDASVTATHGGLECGILSEIIPGLDIIAMGPNSSGEHTPDEQVSISSIGRVWEVLINILAKLK